MAVEMETSVEDVLRRAMTLTSSQRAEVADALYNSLGDEGGEHPSGDEVKAIEQAWVDESHRRLEAHRRHPEKAIPLDVALREIRDELGFAK